MKKLSALILAIILIISAFAGVIPTSAAKADKLAPLSAKSDIAPLGDYFEPCYNEPMDIFNILFGDADMDGALTIKDATLIQKAIAVLVYLSDESLMLADVTGDNYVSINDATAIQKHVAGLEKTFPVYAEFAFSEGSNTTTYSCTGSGYAEIRFTITEADMYFISHGSSSKKNVQAFLCDENGCYIATGYNSYVSDRFYFGGKPLFLRYFEEGTYRIILYTTVDGGYSNQELRISPAKDFLEIDKTSALPLLTGETVTHHCTNMDEVMKVYKFRNDSEVDDALILNAVADDNLQLYIYTEDLECLGYFGDIEKNVSVLIDPSHLKDNEYFYILAYAGLDIRIDLTLDTMTHYLLKNSKYLEYNTPATITSKAIEYIDTTGYLSEGHFSNEGFNFTPAYDGYFSFKADSSFTSTDSNPLIINLTVCDERIMNYDENSILATKTMVFEKSGSDYVTAYLEEGRTYYIYSTVATTGILHSLTVTPSACTEEDHLQSGSTPPKPVDIKEAEALFVGDTKVLSINYENGEILYRFDATADEELVFFSEGDSDPLINIYDKYGNHIVYEDDIDYYNNKLNFALYGKVDAGETYYIGIACHDETAKEMKFSLIKEKDYIYG